MREILTTFRGGGRCECRETTTRGCGEKPPKAKLSRPFLFFVFFLLRIAVREMLREMRQGFTDKGSPINNTVSESG